MAKYDRRQNENMSPLITNLEWGLIEVEGFPPGKDFKLYPGGAMEWDWNETNTRHVPGIQIADVEFLIENGAQHIILSRGMRNRLEVPTETKDYLEDKKSKSGIQYYINSTIDACKLYNELVQKRKPVGALLHSTC